MEKMIDLNLVSDMQEMTPPKALLDIPNDILRSFSSIGDTFAKVNFQTHYL